MVGYVEAIHASSSEGSAVAPDTKQDTKRPAQKFRRHPIGGGWAYATSLGLPDQTETPNSPKKSLTYDPSTLQRSDTTEFCYENKN